MRLSAGLVSISKQTFQSCESDCRTSSGSTRHGNEYKHKFKHCYEAQKPSLKQLTIGDHEKKLRHSFLSLELCSLFLFSCFLFFVLVLDDQQLWKENKKANKIRCE